MSVSNDCAIGVQFYLPKKMFLLFRHSDDRVEVDMFWELASATALMLNESMNNLLMSKEFALSIRKFRWRYTLAI